MSRDVASSTTEQRSRLTLALQDARLAHDSLGALPPAEAAALVDLASQAILSGIDYKSLGLGWDHPQTRLDYRRAAGASIAAPASRRRQAQSRVAIAGVCAALSADATADADANANGATEAAQDAFLRMARQRIVDAFCVEISAGLCAAATFEAVAATLQSELLLPLRALNEGIDSMTTTFNGWPVPRAPIVATVHAITSHVLNGTFSEWRYTNPVGQAQLAPLSASQISVWREPTSATTSAGLRVHEDEGGELGLFWATKIGGPSHGFDVEGQCLLPLLANARHKVILVSDPVWPEHPAGRAHFRLLWVAGTEPPQPVLFLETVNVDFAAAARVNSRPWLPAVLAQAARKAERMRAQLSVEVHLRTELAGVVGSAHQISLRSDRLVLRPSNGVVEASDYLANKHDWVQMEEEVTAPLRRAVYAPLAAVMETRSEL